MEEVHNLIVIRKPSIIYLVIIITFIMSYFTIVSFYRMNEGNQFFYIMKYLSFALFVVGILLYNRNIFVSKGNFLIAILLIISNSLFMFNLKNGASILTSMLFVLVTVSIGITAMNIFTKIDEQTFIKLLWIILVSSILFVLIPNLLLINNDLYYQYYTGRPRFLGKFDNPNEFARFALVSLFVSLRLIKMYKEIYKKAFFFLVIGFSLYIIFITDSRASLIAGVLGISAYLTIYSFKRVKVKPLLILSICSYIIVILISAISYFLKNTEVSFTELNKISTGRLEIWTSIFNTNFVDLMIGSGPVRDGLAAAQIIVSGYLEIFVYFGMIGTVVWMSIIGLLLYRKLKETKGRMGQHRLMGSSIVVIFLIYYLFEGAMVSVGNIACIYFWLELSQREY
jgi:O-antigen ligase